MTPLIRFALAWAFGIWLTEAFQCPVVWLMGLIPPALVLLVGWGDRRWARGVAGAMIAISLGGVRTTLAQPNIGPHHVAFYRDRGQVKISGVVIEDPDRRVKDVRLRVRADELTLAGELPREVEGRVLVYASPYAEIRYGDRIVVSGHLTTPPTYESFDYREYLAHQGIFALIKDGSIGVVASHQASPLLDHLFQFRDRAYTVLSSLLPEPQGALLAGILLGLEHGIPADLANAFAATGTTHIIAISGFNLTLAAGMVMQLARRFLQKRGQFPIALATIWLYVLLVGATPAVARAGVMSSLLALAQREQRRVHGPTSLAAAVLMLSAWRPFVLWDLGFQLSVAATLGMMLYVPPMTRILTRFLDRFIHSERIKRVLLGIGDAMIVTLAVQMVTLGITVIGFGTLSLVAPLTNQLILPVQPLIMCFGFLALFGGLTLRPVGVLFAWITWVFLVYTTLVVSWTASLPYASIALETVPQVWIWAYYCPLGIATAWFGLSKPSREKVWATLLGLDYRLVGGAGALGVLLTVYGLQLPDGKLHVIFLDVGHGDAVYIQTPSGRQVLIDGGPDPRQTLAALGKQMPFWDRSLDLVVLTSPDADRLTGLLPVLERYEVALVAASPEVGTGEEYARWEELLAARSAGSWGVMLSGDTWELDRDVILQALWPPPDQVGPCVLRLDHGEASLLFMGDATTRVEAELVADDGALLRSQVLQLPRRGDDTCCTVPFLQAVNPDVVVVGRSGDRMLAPHLTARLMDVPLYITGRHGPVEVISNGVEIRVRTRQ